MELKVHISTHAPKKEDAFFLVPWQVYGQQLQINMLSKVNLEEACTFLVVTKADIPVGRCALYPPFPTDNGLSCPVGGYECIDNQEVANFLLDQASAQAYARGATNLIGPMEGSTWGSYRFIIGPNPTPFLTEVLHQPYYVEQFVAHGFTTLKKYFSFKDTNLKITSPDFHEALDQLEQKGLTVRNIEMDRLEEELLAVGEFSNEAFSENFLFTEREPDKLKEQYLNLASLINPQHIFLAFWKGKLAALFFGIHNQLDPNGKSIIIKTIARLKSLPFRGVTSLLGGLFYERILKEGYKEVIHAFISEGNHSTALSQKFHGTQMREYALFSKTI